MKKILHDILLFSLFVFLTFLTQVGGVVLVLSIIVYAYFKNILIQKIKHEWITKILIYSILYTIISFGIVPSIAQYFGRVRLPMYGSSHLRPHNIWACILNRNYVESQLKAEVERVAMLLNERFEGSEIQYLDANFPFWNGFPLLPHLSHNDGHKLDLCFFYKDAKTQQATNQKPSSSGYGVFAAPRAGERNRINECLDKGYWQYDYPKYLTFGNRDKDFVLDETRTAAMATLFATSSIIEKIFIEPHLEHRLGLEQFEKIRLHGCQAVRHDDHIHIQSVR
jgi:hypothetical protein